MNITVHLFLLPGCRCNVTSGPSACCHVFLKKSLPLSSLVVSYFVCHSNKTCDRPRRLLNRMHLGWRACVFLHVETAESFPPELGGQTPYPCSVNSICYEKTWGRNKGDCCKGRDKMTVICRQCDYISFKTRAGSTWHLFLVHKIVAYQENVHNPGSLSVPATHSDNVMGKEIQLRLKLGNVNACDIDIF